MGFWPHTGSVYYLVNIPLSAAGILEDNAQGWRIVWKMNNWQTSKALRAALKSSYIPASWKGVYLFLNPLNSFSRPTHKDRSCTFCGFFSFLWEELPTCSFLISPSIYQLPKGANLLNIPICFYKWQLFYETLTFNNTFIWLANTCEKNMPRACKKSLFCWPNKQMNRSISIIYPL